MVKDGRAEQRKLGVAYINHEFIAVSSGLSEGEQFVSVGQSTLRDGARVVVTEKESVR